MITERDIATAKRELQDKAQDEIERETAIKWAARAIAAYIIAREQHNVAVISEADEYRGEALEHAAKAGDFGRLAGTLQRQIDKYRPIITQKGELIG